MVCDHFRPKIVVATVVFMEPKAMLGSLNLKGKTRDEYYLHPA